MWAAVACMSGIAWVRGLRGNAGDSCLRGSPTACRFTPALSGIVAWVCPVSVEPDPRYVDLR